MTKMFAGFSYGMGVSGVSFDLDALLVGDPDED